MARMVWISTLTTLLCLGAAHDEAEGQDVDQVKAWLRDAAPGDDIRVRLSDGGHLEGTLSDVEEARFGLWVAPDASAKERYGDIRALKRWIDYEEVAELLVGGLPVGPASGSGSLSFRLRFGDDARVQTADGTRLKGKVMDFDGDVLQIDGQSLSLNDGDVRRIEVQQRDPLTNGALIGLGAGVAFVGLACAGSAGCDAEIAAVGVLFYGAVGAGIGALVDSLRKPYTTVYVSPDRGLTLSVAPLVMPDAKGVFVSVGF